MMTPTALAVNCPEARSTVPETLRLRVFDGRKSLETAKDEPEKTSVPKIVILGMINSAA